MTSETLAEAARRGADLSVVKWWDDPATEQPHGPPGMWLASEFPDGTIGLGSIDRGVYVVYDRYETASLAADAIVHVTSTAVHSREIVDSEWRSAIDAAGELLDAIRAGRATGPVPAGVALDRFGPLSGDALFAARTPWPQRASPPPDLTQLYTTWVTVAELPPSSQYGIAAPAFEQPGGGLLVRLGRSVRWFYDAGLLDLVVVPDASSPSR